MTGVLFVICALSISVYGKRTPTYLENVECAPYVHYIETDPLNYFRYNPFYVKLFRCYGADSLLNPRNRQCMPTKVGAEDVDIYVHNIGEQKWDTITVQNHTHCEEHCTLEESMCTPYQEFDRNECSCTCRYADAPSPNSTCGDQFYWDKSACNCVCSVDSMRCEKRKVFSRDECSCVCKQKFYIRCAKRKMVVDQDTCECVEPTIETEKSININRCASANIWILVIALVVEFVVLVILYCLCYRYCYKHYYFRMKADKKAESMTKYSYPGLGTEHCETDYARTSRSTIGKSISDTDFDEEVPPFTLHNVNKGVNNNQNGLYGNGPKITNKLINMEDSENIYPSDKGSVFNPSHSVNGALYNNTLRSVYNDVEPIIRDYDYECEISMQKNYKNISLV